MLARADGNNSSYANENSLHTGPEYSVAERLPSVCTDGDPASRGSSASGRAFDDSERARMNRQAREEARMNGKMTEPPKWSNLRDMIDDDDKLDALIIQVRCTTRASFLAEISVSSPRKKIIFII